MRLPLRAGTVKQDDVGKKSETNIIKKWNYCVIHGKK